MISKSRAKWRKSRSLDLTFFVAFPEFFLINTTYPQTCYNSTLHRNALAVDEYTILLDQYFHIPNYVCFACLLENIQNDLFLLITLFPVSLLKCQHMEISNTTCVFHEAHLFLGVNYSCFIHYLLDVQGSQLKGSELVPLYLKCSSLTP